MTETNQVVSDASILNVVSSISFSDVPLPCVPDVPMFPFEDLEEIEKDTVAGLEPCYVHNCAAKDTKLWVHKILLSHLRILGDVCKWTFRKTDLGAWAKRHILSLYILGTVEQSSPVFGTKL